ncbi:transposase-like protein [Streptomyces sp. TE3672]
MLADRVKWSSGWSWWRGLFVGNRPPSYKGHRYPVEIIAQCVWLYFRFPVSFREVEELMLGRGVIVSHETVRR